jgi:hypothetical protein
MTNTTTTADVQLRGHCQRCGRLQAITRATMAHHGYTVEDGYFRGKCFGHQYAPIEQNRAVADVLIAHVRGEAAEHRATLARLVSGESHPATVVVRTKWDHQARKSVDETLPWADANDLQRAEALRRAIAATEQRAKMADAWADQMAALCDRVHGQALVEVQRAEAPEAIPHGDKRQAKGGAVLVCQYVARGMVHYHYTRESQPGKRFESRMATRSWRVLPKVPA